MILNREDKGEFFLSIAPDGDIWIKRSEMEKTGLKEGVGEDTELEGERYVSLKSIPGLTYRLNEEDVSIEITAEPDLFKVRDTDLAYKKSYRVKVSETPAAFLNYALTYDDVVDGSFFEAASELGLGAGDYFGKSTFKYEKTVEEERFVRLITNITHNDREKLKTLVFGDLSALSGALGSVAVLGGVGVSKNFAIDPGFLIFPPLNLSGTLETPSEVALYLDSLLVRKEKLPPGRFIYSDVPATVGLGAAKIVIKDAYGREEIKTIPYYYSSRLLKRGLHEYSFSAGFLREKYGAESFAYGDPAFLGFHNYGLTEYLKIGYAAEASPDVINIGPAASILAPSAGVFDAALAYSSFKGESGLGGQLSYSFQSSVLSARASARYASKRYSSLSVTPSDDKARLLFTGALGFGGKRTGFISLEYSQADMYETAKASRLSLSYNKVVTDKATFFLTAARTKDAEAEDEILLGLHVYFGKDVSGNAWHASSGGVETEKVRIQKSLPAGDGFGFRSDLESSGADRSVDGSVRYQNGMGIYEARYANKNKDDGFGVSMSGGVGYIDGSVFLSRPVNDSFAKVKVGALKDVRVYFNGNEEGRTDHKGEFIVSDIRSFHDNKIAIESADIPLNYAIPAVSQYISPPFRSGSLVEFDVKKTQGVTGSAYISRNGEVVPAEYSVLFVQAENAAIEGLVGKEGEFYIENVPAGRHGAKLFYKGKECRFDMIIPESDETVLDIGKVTCEVKNE
ncbi:MAG: fimbrial biogenesis outer membrane usher protein [Nitrospirae bacterium]|nr:fimbrial biogenesis outer membrane usher protein [Nitrospirota bacterium]